MPSNEYFDSSGAPTSKSTLSSAAVRNEFDSVEAGFLKLPTLAANGDKPIFVNSGGTAMEAKSVADANTLLGTELTSRKDASSGYAGLTLFKINFKNALNTITSFFTNVNTVQRTYTFQDRDGTIADNTDLTLKADTATVTSALALKANIADIESFGIGVGQSWVEWQPIDGVRDVNIEYQNTTGKPIQVSVSGILSANSTSNLAGLKVGASSPPGVWATVTQTDTTHSLSCILTAIIPPGHYYKADVPAMVGKFLLFRWAELR